MDEKLITQLQQKLDPDKDMNELVNDASQLVSEMTQMAGIISIMAVM